MVRMYNACTTEIDETEAAVAEILEQLDFDEILMEHSVGFITTYYEFIESGVVEAICKALPFEVVGGTTLSNGIENNAGTMNLCLTVLTSDDCNFAAITTEDLTDGMDEKIAKAYEEACTILPEKPKVAFCFLPMLMVISGEEILERMDANCPDVLFYGAATCDHDTRDFSNSFTIHNGVSSKKQLSLLFISGNFEPEFSLVTVSEKVIQRSKAVITKSDSHRLIEVNGLPMREYLNSIGLMKGSEVEAVHVIPFLVDYNDGSPEVARALMSMDDEGTAVCGGKMPEQSTLAIGKSDFNDLMQTSGQTAQNALASGKHNGLWMVSCAGRHLTLGADVTAEFEEVEKYIGEQMPYHLSYSGGEICPVYDEKAGKYINRYHNFTFTACIF